MLLVAVTLVAVTLVAVTLHCPLLSLHVFTSVRYCGQFGWLGDMDMCVPLHCNIDAFPCRIDLEVFAVARSHVRESSDVVCAAALRCEHGDGRCSK